MKIRILPVLIFLLLVLCPAVWAGESISVANGEWPPYMSESFKFGGFGTRVCTEAFAQEGIQAEYIYLPWKRALIMAAHGTYDATLGWKKTPEREEQFYFSDPVLTANEVFFYRKDSQFDWETLGDIGHMTIGGTLSYKHIELLRPVVDRHGGKLEIATSDEINLHKLIEGRIDLFPCDESVGYYLLRTRFMPGAADLIQHHPTPLSTDHNCLLISKKVKNGKELIDRFNRGLRKLKENGLYDQYMYESRRGDYIPAK